MSTEFLDLKIKIRKIHDSTLFQYLIFGGIYHEKHTNKKRPNLLLRHS